MTEYSLTFPRAHLSTRAAAEFRQQPEDFFVNEELGFDLSGDGEHLWIQVEKTGLNTLDVVRTLSRISGVHGKDIGYAGLKDKNAVTRQWFSLKTNREMSEPASGPGSFRLLTQQRNSRKLRRGSHRRNHFRITLRDVTDMSESPESVRMLIQSRGVPNYFGLQRFGHLGNNLFQALAFFNSSLGNISRFQRGITLSAARAYIFNRVLAQRVEDGNWDKWLPGDVMSLAGTASVFSTRDDDPEIQGRLEALDIHPTGPLWGSGQLSTGSVTRDLESAVAAQYQDLAAGLETAGLKQERRPLRVVPENLVITPAGNRQLVIEFSLPTGAYATSVLREMVDAEGL